jgi:hypothetical protein
MLFGVVEFNLPRCKGEAGVVKEASLASRAVDVSKPAPANFLSVEAPQQNPCIDRYFGNPKDCSSLSWCKFPSLAAVLAVIFKSARFHTSTPQGQGDEPYMKKITIYGIAAALALVFAGCDDEDDDYEHHHGHGHHGSVSSTTTTEETTVHQAAPSATTTVRTY